MLVCGSCKHVRDHYLGFYLLNALRFQVSHTYEDFMDLSLSIRSEDDKDSKVNKENLHLHSLPDIITAKPS